MRKRAGCTGPSSHKASGGAVAGSKAHRVGAAAWRTFALLLMLASTVFLPVPAAAQDAFPLLVDPSRPIEVQSAERPGWVFVNSGAEPRTVVRVTAGEGPAEHLVGEVESRPAHQVLFVSAANATEGEDRGSESFFVRAAGRAWVAWVPEARLLRPSGDTLFVPCLEEHPVAYLWSVPNGTGTLAVEGKGAGTAPPASPASVDDGTGPGLEVFVFSAQPFRMALQATANITYDGRLVDGGDDAFWVVARPAPGTCREGVELRFASTGSDVPDVLSPVSWLFLLGGLLIVSFIVFARPPRGRVGASKGPRLRRAMHTSAATSRIAFGTLLVALLVQGVGGAAASHGGGFEVLTLPEDGSLASVTGAMGGERVLCAQAPEGPANVMYRAERGRDTVKAGALQVPVAPESTCIPMPEADRYTFQVQAGAEQGVRAFVAPGPMMEMQRPSSVPVLDPPGRFLVVPEVRERARVASLTEDPWDVHVIDPRTFEVIAQGDPDARETELVSRGGAGDAEGAPLWIVVSTDQEPNGRSAHVAWDDPDWFPTAPSFGEVLVVVVAALLIVLYKGRPRQDRLRRYGSDAAEEARRRGDRGPFGEESTT